MKTLKKIDLSQATEMMDKIEAMQRAVDVEKKKLTELLVNLNLEYYGSSPSKFYQSIHKEYCTEDGFSVKIDAGSISISKKITDNLTVKFLERFYESTSFSVIRCLFLYDSGRCIQWSNQKQKIAEKHAAEFARFEEILQEEQIYNPFSAFGNYISFVDFHKENK